MTSPFVADFLSSMPGRRSHRSELHRTPNVNEYGMDAARGLRRSGHPLDFFLFLDLARRATVLERVVPIDYDTT